jgi:small GTP-binding protein
MNLREYEQDKFAIADILRSASTLAASDAYDWQQRARDLFIRLAEDRFNLVVVGHFNRGKTSLMNAIIGSNRLPVGIVPLTSVITTVSYDTSERVVLTFFDRRLAQEVPIEALREYVTQDGNPANTRGIRVADIKLRAELLRRGFFFVDTPGLGSAIVENTRTTEAFLPEADAFLVVTSYESPVSEEEIKLFRRVANSGKRIFVIINKHDVVTEIDRDVALTYVRSQLQEVFGDDIPQVFSVSARDGLDAKNDKDNSRLASSGIPSLEEALLEFLLTEKKGKFLQYMCQRTADVISALPTSPQTRALLDSLAVLAAHVAHHDQAVSEENPPTPSYIEAPTLRQLRSCEICTRINDALWDFECKYQYELSVSRDAQRHFVESGGLCSFHTWQYHSIASPYGICTAFPSFLDHLAARLRAHSDVPPGSMAERTLSPLRHCALCKLRNDVESEAIAALVDKLSNQPASTLSSLSAICMPHLALLTSALTNRDLVRQLIEHQATLLERLSEEMRRLSLKRDATRRNLETKEELTAAERALLLLAGHRNVFGGDARLSSNVFVPDRESVP